ncbi:MAG: hypothetical protein AMXMBFR84_26280 [Candidatus Hydrogenedentota bacterium]
MKTFGTVSFQNGFWTIHAAPHVNMRLKRVFPKTDHSRYGAVTIADTIEVCRELEWFMERFPLSMDADTAARLRENAAKHRDRESLIDQLLSGARQPREFSMLLPPRTYQQVAAEMALATGGLLIADDVGLGKTITGICTLLEEARRPALVVTLTSLPWQWAEQIQKFTGMSTHILKKGTPYDLTATRRRNTAQADLFNKLPDVIITNYHKLDGWAETLAPIVKSVIFDEAQELRRPDSNKYAAAKHIADHCGLRVGLTATPIFNFGDEMHSVLECITPGALGTRDEFNVEWCHQADYMGRRRVKNPAGFGSYLRDAGLMIRRTRKDVGRELPGLSRISHFVDCDLEHLHRVESAATELAKVILSANTVSRGAQMQASSELSNLVRQATGIAKAPYVAEFVRMIVENGDPVVLYGWHREVYSIWLERLKEFTPVMFTGSESPTQKEASKRAFIRGSSKVLIVSLRAGAGLDGLQHVCSTTVFGELDWTPACHEQCEGRVYRDGQPNPVMSYYLLANHGSDPIVGDVLGVKATQAKGVNDPSAPLVEKLQLDPERIKRLAEQYLHRRKAVI